MEMWEPKPPGTLWATPGLLQDSFTFIFHLIWFLHVSSGRRSQGTCGQIA